MKKIWITSLINNQTDLQCLINLLKPYKINVDGSFWQEDPKQMAWSNSQESIVDKDIGLWIVLTDEVTLQSNSIRKGLSALALMVEVNRPDLPLMILITDYNDQNQLKLPTPLKHAQIIALNSSNLGVKIVSKLNLPSSKRDYDYRLKLYPLRELGLWLELGPKHPLVWQGIMLGVNGAEINFQAEGAKGTLPEQSTLEYPQQGLKIKSSDTEFIAWAIQNAINDNRSYFARISELPDQILFGAYTQNDETEAYILNFC